MNQPTYILANGTRVQTHAELPQPKGMLVSPGYLGSRVADTSGVISGIVGGHGGDVYWVTHPDGSVAPYCFDEFELAQTDCGGGLGPDVCGGCDACLARMYPEVQP